MSRTSTKKSDTDPKKSIEDACRAAISKASQGQTKEAKKMFDEAKKLASKMEYESQIQALRTIKEGQTHAELFHEASKTADSMKKLEKEHGKLPHDSPLIGILGLISSGKTSFLVSLLNFLVSHEDFAIDYPRDEKFREGENHIRNELARWRQGLFPRVTEIGKEYLVVADVYRRNDREKRIRLMIPDMAGENLLRVFNTLSDQGQLDNPLGPPHAISSEEVRKLRDLMYNILEDCDGFLYIIDPKKDPLYQIVQDNVLYNIQREIAHIKTEKSENGQEKFPRFWARKKAAVPCAVVITKIDEYEYLEDNFEDWLRNNLPQFISKVSEMAGDDGEGLSNFCFTCSAVTRVDTKASSIKILDSTPRNILEGPLSYFFGEFFRPLLKEENKKENDEEDEDDEEEEKKRLMKKSKSGRVLRKRS